MRVYLPPRRILDLDLENAPLTYLGSDFTTARITAIAAGWADERKIRCWAIPECTTEEMLEGFVALYNQADMVTGHYLRKHDLPHINGALMEFGMRPLSPKLVSDTKIDLVKRAGISASQENLAEMFGLPEPKYQMNQVKWREANRLTPKGVSLTKKRVISDVQQHKALRLAMIEAEILGPPRMWAP